MKWFWSNSQKLLLRLPLVPVPLMHEGITLETLKWPLCCRQTCWATRKTCCSFDPDPLRTFLLLMFSMHTKLWYFKLSQNRKRCHRIDLFAQLVCEHLVISDHTHTHLLSRRLFEWTTRLHVDAALKCINVISFSADVATTCWTWTTRRKIKEREYFKVDLAQQHQTKVTPTRVF